MKNKKRQFQVRYKGGPLGALVLQAKFQQDAKPRRIYSVRTEWAD